MKKILVPTDFSKHSDYALEYASFLAKGKDLKLYILHVVHHTKELEDIHQKLSRLTKQSFFKDVDYEIKLEDGTHVSKTINKVGIELGIDLVIMGSNGASNLEEILLGSNTENVIRQTKFNVLTIKHKMFDIKMNSILFPSDFSHESFAIFKTVKSFADLFNAKIHLLRVNSPQHHESVEGITKKMNKLISTFHLDENPECYKKIIYDDISEELGILNYCIDGDVDLIMIGSHGKSVLHKLIQVSTSQSLVRDSFRPILTIRF